MRIDAALNRMTIRDSRTFELAAATRLLPTIEAGGLSTDKISAAVAGGLPWTEDLFDAFTELHQAVERLLIDVGDPCDDADVRTGWMAAHAVSAIEAILQPTSAPRVLRIAEMARRADDDPADQWVTVGQIRHRNSRAAALFAELAPTWTSSPEALDLACTAALSSPTMTTGR